MPRRNIASLSNRPGGLVNFFYYGVGVQPETVKLEICVCQVGTVAGATGGTKYSFTYQKVQSSVGSIVMLEYEPHFPSPFPDVSSSDAV